MDYSLFRIKVLLQKQSELFAAPPSPSVVLHDAIVSKPWAKSWRGAVWHIGNVQHLDAAGIYFALGRTTTKAMEVLDPETNDFLKIPFETAPFTHVVIDTDLEVCAIAHKPDLIPKTSELGPRLERVLANAGPVLEVFANVSVSPISEPDQFIKALLEAYSIKSFTVGFTPPNLFDVDDFLKPMERLARETNAAKGQTTVTGQDLKRETLRDLTLSAAASGDDARAKVIPERGKKATTRRLRQDSARLTHLSVEEPAERRNLLRMIRETYKRIRGK